MRLAGVLCSVGLFVLILSGCGGGSTRYSRTALEDCLKKNSVETSDHQQFISKFAPSSFAAAFNKQEFAVFMFGKDSGAAKSIANHFSERIKTAGKGTMSRHGNLVVVQSRHISTGTVKTIQACEKDAEVS